MVGWGEVGWGGGGGRSGLTPDFFCSRIWCKDVVPYASSMCFSLACCANTLQLLLLCTVAY